MGSPQERNEVETVSKILGEIGVDITSHLRIVSSLEHLDPEIRKGFHTYLSSIMDPINAGEVAREDVADKINSKAESFFALARQKMERGVFEDAKRKGYTEGYEQGRIDASEKVTEEMIAKAEERARNGLDEKVKKEIADLKMSQEGYIRAIQIITEEKTTLESRLNEQSLEIGAQIEDLNKRHERDVKEVVSDAKRQMRDSEIEIESLNKKIKSLEKQGGFSFYKTFFYLCLMTGVFFVGKFYAEGHLDATISWIKNLFMNK